MRVRRRAPRLYQHGPQLQRQGSRSRSPRYRHALARGQRYGFIRFGSRVDVYLPPYATPKVAIGYAVHDRTASTLATDVLEDADGSLLVINTGGKLVVVDTGNGPGAFASSKGNVGQFASNMAAAGIDPKSIDMVVISHFHGDHINGLLNAEGALAFANAEVLVPSVEWKYFMDDGEMAKQTGERMPGVFKNARRVFEAGLNKKVTPYEWGKEVAPGLLAVETAGHTPGHTSYVLSSGSGKVFIQSDVTNVPYLFAANPGWHAFFDQDAAMAEKARRKTYDMVVAEKLQVQGFHFPFPGLGNVVRQNAPSLISSLGQRTVLEGKAAVALPLRFVDGAVFLGPIPVGKMPPGRICR